MTQEKPLHRLSILFLVRAAPHINEVFQKDGGVGLKASKKKWYITTFSYSIKNTGMCYRTQLHTMG